MSCKGRCLSATLNVQTSNRDRISPEAPFSPASAEPIAVVAEGTIDGRLPVGHGCLAGAAWAVGPVSSGAMRLADSTILVTLGKDPLHRFVPDSQQPDGVGWQMNLLAEPPWPVGRRRVN